MRMMADHRDGDVIDRQKRQVNVTIMGVSGVHFLENVKQSELMLSGISLDHRKPSRMLEG